MYTIHFIREQLKLTSALSECVDLKRKIIEVYERQFYITRSVYDFVSKTRYFSEEKIKLLQTYYFSISDNII